MAVKYWCACCCDILGTPHLGRVTHQMSEGLGHILHRRGSGVHLRVLWKGLVKIRFATHQGGWLGSIVCAAISTAILGESRCAVGIKAKDAVGTLSAGCTQADHFPHVTSVFSFEQF